MASYADLQRRIDSVSSRADAVLAERLKQEIAARERAAAEERQAEREEARAQAERNLEYRTRYADAFQAFGTEVPAPVAGESPFAFRRRLFAGLQHRLGADHDLAELRADDISGPAMRNFEGMLLAEAQKEGERPSYANLPRDGGMVMRVRSDANTGGKFNEFYSRELFIKSMGREGRRVLRLIDPRTRSVLLGAPFSRDG